MGRKSNFRSALHPLDPVGGRYRSQWDSQYGTLEEPYFQTTTFSAGTYLALPLGALHSTLVVFSGVGILTTRLEAESFASKLVLIVTIYETPMVPISFTVARTLMGSFTFDVER